MLDHNLRRTAIGGSEIAAIFGCDTDRDAFSIWYAKKHPHDSYPPNDRMIVGKALERPIIDLYAYATGREVEFCDITSIHPQRPWMAYTPDALCVHERRGIDAKAVCWDQRSVWGETTDEIPFRVQLQAMWYMAAMEYEVWDIAALLGDGLPRIYTVYRDPEVERVILARAEEFYRRYIIGNEQPPIGTSDAARIWLQQAFPRHKSPDLREATAGEIFLLEEFVNIRTQQAGLKQRREWVENQIKLAIGDREGLIWADGRFTWRKQADKETINWENIARGLLAQYLPDTEQQKTLIGIHTTIEEGTRRIYCKAYSSAAEAA